jgi:FAD/FMN-containing dehydrogenase
MSTNAIVTLKQTFSGNIILPEDSSYEEARKTMMRTGSPAIVLQPKTTQDVVAAIAYAKEVGGPLSVRSGGHSGPGFGTNEGGTVIDVRGLHSVEILDADARLVRIGSGAEWGAVAKTLGEHDLALSSGDTTTVGVGGLTLGGGIGWMVRQYGLAIDSLVGAEIVTASGEVLQLSAQENEDLFWGIRGGGGNFGVVTHFDFTAHPLDGVVSGSIKYGIQDLPTVLTGWRDTMRSADEKLSSMLITFPSFGPNAPANATIVVCYASTDEAEAHAAIAPLLKLGSDPAADIKPMAYADVLQEAHPPGGMHVVAKNVFMDTMTDELINDITALYKDGAPAPVLQIRSVGGAMNRIAADATAFAHRSSEILLVGASFFPGDASAETIEQGLQPWKALSATGNGAYANLLSQADAHDLAAAYPATTHEKLVAIKRAYDPDNFFRQNYNIEP